MRLVNTSSVSAVEDLEVNDVGLCPSRAFQIRVPVRCGAVEETGSRHMGLRTVLGLVWS